MKINKEMAENILRWHLELKDKRDVTNESIDSLTLIKYLLEEIELIKEKLNADKPQAE